MVNNTFEKRLDQLSDTIGRGDLTGEFVVSQRYAAYQHVHRDLRHPRGGGPDYVSIPLMARHPEWFKLIASVLLAGKAVEAMGRAMQDLNHQVEVLAPIDTGDLRGSGRFTVYDGGTPAITEPPKAPRRPR